MMFLCSFEKRFHGIEEKLEKQGLGKIRRLVG
jgi:hypothetical protein